MIRYIYGRLPAPEASDSSRLNLSLGEEGLIRMAMPISVPVLGVSVSVSLHIPVHLLSPLPTVFGCYPLRKGLSLAFRGEEEDRMPSGSDSASDSHMRHAFRFLGRGACVLPPLPQLLWGTQLVILSFLKE